MMGEVGFYPTVVERPRNKLEAISAAQTCALGPKRLQAYRKEWDEDCGVWKDRPRHDDASHGADSFLTFACRDYTPPSVETASIGRCIIRTAGCRLTCLSPRLLTNGAFFYAVKRSTVTTSS